MVGLWIPELGDGDSGFQSPPMSSGMHQNKDVSGPAPKQRRVWPLCAVRDIIVDEMKQLSFDVILKTKANSPDIVVALQNVEEIGNQKWDSDPFKVHEHNNRLFCRGKSDIIRLPLIFVPVVFSRICFGAVHIVK